MFNLLRHYAITSLIGIAVAAVLLVAFYRQLELQEGMELIRKNDQALAENVLNSVRPELSEYLASISKSGPQEISRAPVPASLASVIAQTMKDASLAEVKVYNNLGVIAYSSRPGQIGTVEADRTGFISASGGKAISNFNYRDTFSGLGQAGPEQNLAHTYVPVRSGRTGPVSGVFSISTDLSPLAAQNEHEVFAVITGIVSILALLYCVLLVTVIRAQRIINAQQATIRDRTANLEALSAQMLRDQEIEKQKLATGLHEDLAQTLSAIKLRIEDSLDPARAGKSGPASLTTAVSALQGVIEELQHTAMDLRPSSLDELGLLPTVRWYCRQIEQMHPGIRIDQEIAVQEDEIPGQLKIAIYRIIETVLKDFAGYASSDRIQLALRRTAGGVTLAIDDIPEASNITPLAPASGVPDLRRRFVLAQERTTLSGGTFSAAKNRHGGITLNADWNVPAEQFRVYGGAPDIGSDAEQRADQAPSQLAAGIRREAA